MKILLLGDYSNCHATLAAGLRSLGCEVTVASDGSRWLKCDRDIDLTRRPGKLGGLMHYLHFKSLLNSRFTGYDVVALNDICFANLRPSRTRQLLDGLRRRNRSIFLSAMSTDLPYLNMLSASDSPLKYSEWFVDGKPSRMNAAYPERWEAWHQKDLVDYQEYAFSKLDGAVSVLYEYHLGMERALGAERCGYGGIPIDTNLFPLLDIPEKPEKVRIFLGRDRTRQLEKGSDLLEEAARKVVGRHPDKAEFVLVENRPLSEFTELLQSSHIVLDQIYSYSPATIALMAMAYGKTVVSGAEPEYYDFIGERDNRPIVNAPIELDPLTDAIETLVLHPEMLRERGLRSREFVIKHNDSRIVARRFLDFWTSRLPSK